MDKNIELTDLSRILVGNAPPEFLLEVFIRTLIIYTLLIIVMRWLGKRMNGKLTLTEMSVILTLGAIVSVPMQSPDRGLLQGVIVLFCALVYQRMIALLGFKYKRIELITQGTISMLVKDGIILRHSMRKSRISNQQLFAMLRSKNIYHLGQVQRVYLEASGLFSIYKAGEAAPGLSTLPETDQDIGHSQQAASGLEACMNCGYVQSSHKEKHCALCNHKEWAEAKA